MAQATAETWPPLSRRAALGVLTPRQQQRPQRKHTHLMLQPAPHALPPLVGFHPRVQRQLRLVPGHFEEVEGIEVEGHVFKGGG